MGGIVKNAPNSLIWAVTLAFLGVLVAFTVLSVTGADTADLLDFLQTVLGIVAAVFSGGALVVSGAAARSAGRTEEQTNGQLDQRIETGVRRALKLPTRAEESDSYPQDYK